MTNEHNFKVGDRVRLKGNDAFVGTIVDVGLYSADIIWDCEPNEIYLQAFDCIEHIDRRMVFLTRLQSLLREFDAKIKPEFNSYADMGIVSILVGAEYVVESVDTITADNIMDFDKEGV